MAYAPLRTRVEDLTVIMPTFNKVPRKWAAYHKQVLFDAIGETPLITISREPLDWGQNLLQTEYGLLNLLKQLLRGARLAATPFIAIAEDDTLYPKEHFTFRPPLDRIAYDMNRWIVFTWGKPLYFHKPHASNGGMIAPRELFIEALEARFARYPDEMPRWLLKEVGRHEGKYGMKEIQTLNFYSSSPFLCFNHDYSVDSSQVHHNKRVWAVQAFDIPVWGRAEDVRKRFI